MDVAHCGGIAKAKIAVVAAAQDLGVPPHSSVGRLRSPQGIRASRLRVTQGDWRRFDARSR
jgi:hypothetical protein